MTRMYEDTKTWNRGVGCGFHCNYCVPSFQETVAHFAKLSGSKCKKCLTYEPHEHPERMKIPSKPIVFVDGNGDISFERPAFVRQTIAIMVDHHTRCPKKLFYLQSKNPTCFNQYLDDLRLIEGSVVLLTTLETNRDFGYEEVSKAPLPSTRFIDFKALPWKRKRVTVEPVMAFDLEPFVNWIKEIEPEAVYLGYNSRPTRVHLHEPTNEEFRRLHARLCEFTEVRLKDTRGTI